MSYTIKNGSPRPVLLGIKDSSGRPPVYEPETYPTHLPHVMILAERGKTLPILTSGDHMMRELGRSTFDVRSKFANHQTVLATTINAAANSMMVQRIVPPDAGPPAGMRLWLDVLKVEVPTYERSVDGRYLLDNGARIPTGETVPGVKLRWAVTAINELPDTAGTFPDDPTSELTETGELARLQSKFGQASIAVGEMVDSEGTESRMYPIADFEVDSFGSYGNRLGIRLSAPTTINGTTDDRFAREAGAFIYRLQFVERDDDVTTPRVLETLWGEQFVNFTFKEKVYNSRVNQEYHLLYKVFDNYYQEPSTGLPELNSPFGKVHVWQDHLETILSELHAVEVPYGHIPEDEDQKHLINVLTAVDLDGVPYEAIQVVGMAEDGVTFAATNTYYAMNGTDGSLDDTTFDLAVRQQVRHYGDLEAKFLNDAIYPQSVVYDSGFSMETKKAMFTIIGRRKDMYVAVSTQDVQMRQNTESEESSIAIALRTAARLYPESEYYGTETCRAIIIGQSGYLLDHPYRKLLPLTIEFAAKSARYMGASNGVWNANAKPDDHPNNMVQMFTGVNATYKPENARTRDWDNGLVWVQDFDRRSLFWPQYQTVYADDSSVINGAMNMIIAVDLQKQALRSWRRLTGITHLTPGQFLDRVKRVSEALVKGKYDGRVIIEVEPFLTAQDVQRGYSWSAVFHMYAPNMMTVGSFTVESHRISDHPSVGSEG